MLDVNDTEVLMVQGKIEYDDKDLIYQYRKSKKESREKFRSLEAKRLDGNENDYLSFVIARLAYEFAKEENDLLLNEIKRRGLTLTI